MLGGRAVVAHAQNNATTAAAPAPLSRVGTFIFQWGVGRGVSSATGGAADREGSAPSVSQIVITKVRDTASPNLMQAAASGKRIPVVAIDFVRGDKQLVYQVKLSDVLISKYSLSPEATVQPSR